jgi:threonine synthase
LSNKRISYYSTNLKSDPVSFSEALLKGLAPDGGLYMPSSLPILSNDELENLAELDYSDIAFTVLKKIIGDEIESDDLEKICRESYDFEVPLEHVSDRKFIMRLDRGPTASFKDFAARMMSRLMQYYLSRTNRKLTILTATSGDTGSAVANAFYGLNNINVIILYPVGEVSLMQRKQMTTLGKNITVIGINGKFDDCQRLVKTAFTDRSLKHLPLSSANSINTGRLLPQSVYYFYAWSRLKTYRNDAIIFSVPSGNFGNLMGGLIAKEMGLPVKKFVISTNSNKEVPEFLKTGIYNSINPSINCISSAMNVGHPSNLARVVALYNGVMNEKGEITKEPDMPKLRNDLEGFSVTDDETRKTISKAYNKYGVVLEPHGAVAWKGIEEYLRIHEDDSEVLFVSLETAHPAKFPDEIREIIGIEPLLPQSLSGLTDKIENFLTLDNSYEEIKKILIINAQDN